MARASPFEPRVLLGFGLSMPMDQMGNYFRLVFAVRDFSPARSGRPSLAEIRVRGQRSLSKFRAPKLAQRLVLGALVLPSGPGQRGKHKGARNRPLSKFRAPEKLNLN